MRPLTLIVLLLAVGYVRTAGATTQISTASLRLAFADNGSLISAVACYPACGGAETSRTEFGSGGVITFDGNDEASWALDSHDEKNHTVLSFSNPSGKFLSWRIPLDGYLLELESDDVGVIRLHSGAGFRPREAAGFGGWLEQLRYVVIADDGVTQTALDEESPTIIDQAQWAGFRNRYWALMAGGSGRVAPRLLTASDREDAELVVAAGDRRLGIYLGPVEPVELRTADPSLSDLLYAGLWFWLRWVCFALFHMLWWISMAVPSWGLAVMVLSLCVHVLMLPLSRIADRFQQQVHATEARLAPELHRIKKNFKGEEQAAKILALYKTERVHPLYSLKSLVGVAVVIPIFIGAFDMLAENIHLLDAGFLWISDLSQPDAVAHLPLRLPFFGADLNLLPLLMTGLSVVASSLHNPPVLNAELRKKQVRNMWLLAVGFFVMFYTFPAGMVLYWTTNNLISVVKSLVARRYNAGHPDAQSENR